jgi:ligand-binding sensor domain-containing protein
MVTDVVEDGRGLWFGTYGGGVVRYAGGGWETWALDEGLGGNQIQAIRQEQDGPIWFLHSGTGLSRYQPQDDGWQVFGGAEGAADWPAVPDVDSEGHLWTGDYGALLRYDGERWQRLTAPELADAQVYRVEIGPDDVQWLVTDRGLVRHDPTAEDTDGWTTFTEDDHPLIQELWSIQATSDGSVWLGGEEGLVQYDGRTWRSPAAAGDAPRRVNDLAQAPDGSLWVVADGKLAHLAEDRWAAFVWPGEGWIERVTVGPDGNVWAGYDGLGRYDPDSGEWQIFTPEDGLVNWTVLAIHVTPEGVVWVGTEGGVSRYVPPD